MLQLAVLCVALVMVNPPEEGWKSKLLKKTIRRSREAKVQSAYSQRCQEPPESGSLKLASELELEDNLRPVGLTSKLGSKRRAGTDEKFFTSDSCVVRDTYRLNMSHHLANISYTSVVSAA